MIIHYPLLRKAPRLEASFSDPWGGFRKASNSALTSEEREFLLARMIGGDGADGDLCIIHNIIYIYIYIHMYIHIQYVYFWLFIDHVFFLIYSNLFMYMYVFKFICSSNFILINCLCVFFIQI